MPVLNMQAVINKLWQSLGQWSFALVSRTRKKERKDIQKTNEKKKKEKRKKV